LTQKYPRLQIRFKAAARFQRIHRKKRGAAHRPASPGTVEYKERSVERRPGTSLGGMMRVLILRVLTHPLIGMLLLFEIQLLGWLLTVRSRRALHRALSP